MEITEQPTKEPELFPYEFSVVSLKHNYNEKKTTLKVKLTNKLSPIRTDYFEFTVNTKTLNEVGIDNNHPIHSDKLNLTKEQKQKLLLESQNYIETLSNHKLNEHLEWLRFRSFVKELTPHSSKNFLSLSRKIDEILETLEKGFDSMHLALLESNPVTMNLTVKRNVLISWGSIESVNTEIIERFFIYYSVISGKVLISHSKSTGDVQEFLNFLYEDKNGLIYLEAH